MTLLLVGIFLTELVKYGIWFRGIQGLQFRRLWLGGILAGIYLVLILVGVVNEDTLLIFWSIISVIICGVVIEDKNVLVTLLQAIFILNCIDEIIIAFFVYCPMIWNTREEIKVYYFVSNIVAVVLLTTLKW